MFPEVIERPFNPLKSLSKIGHILAVPAHFFLRVCLFVDVKIKQKYWYFIFITTFYALLSTLVDYAVIRSWSHCFLGFYEQIKSQQTKIDLERNHKKDKDINGKYDVIFA